MGILTIFFIALGLSLDALAISIASGAVIKNLRFNHALKMGLFFGSFQAIMPLIGWLAGLGLRSFIIGFDHWIAFGLLSLIGCKMFYESFRIDEGRKVVNPPMDTYVLLILSIATSVDALAVGLSLSFLNISLLGPVVIIGLVTFLLSSGGVFAGHKLGYFFGNRIEIIAGLIMIGAGVKILMEHLVR